MIRKFSIFLFLLLVFYQTFSIAFFYQTTGSVFDEILLEKSYNGVTISLGFTTVNLFELIIIAVSLILLYYFNNTTVILKKNFIIKLIYIYSFYQICFIIPLSMFNYNLSLMETLRGLFTRLSVLLIPFFYFFTLPALKNKFNIITIIDLSSFILVIVGVWNFFNNNVFITNTSQNRLLWGGSVLIFAMSFYENFLKSKKHTYNYLMIIISSFGIIMTNHRSGFIYFILVLIVGIIISYKKNKKLLIPFVLFCVAIIVINNNEALNISFIERLETTNVNDDNAIGRIQNWALAFDFFLDNPINGSMMKNQYYAGKNIDNYPPHNFIFELLTTQGIIGFVFYIIIITKALTIAYSNKSDSKSIVMFLTLLFYVLYSTFNVTFLNQWNLSIFVLSISIILFQDKQIKIINR